MKIPTEIRLITQTPIQGVGTLWAQRFEIPIGGYSGVRNELHDICLVRISDSEFSLTLKGFTSEAEAELRSVMNDAD